MNFNLLTQLKDLAPSVSGVLLIALILCTLDPTHVM